MLFQTSEQQNRSKSTKSHRVLPVVNRSQFLRTTAGFITVSGLSTLNHCQSTPNRTEQMKAQAKFDTAKTKQGRYSKQPIIRAAVIGITAPNPHNTQAWRFKFLNPYTMELYVDPERILPATDPTTRQIHIGQGTFLEMMAIGASTLGYQATIRLFPKGEYAPNEVGKKPVARVVLSPTDAPPDALSSYYKERATNRAVYHGPLLKKEELNSVSTDAGSRFCQMGFVTSPEVLAKNNALVFQAMQTEMTTYHTADESYQWLRISDKDIYAKRDGISLRGGGLSGFKLWMARTFFVGDDRTSYHDPSSVNQYLEIFKEKVESSKAYILLQTKSNTLTDWVNTGRDYMRLHLSVTKAGLVMHPVSQILQEYPEMASLQQEFNHLHKVPSGGKVQMMVRLGRSDYRFYAPRRLVAAMLLPG